MSDPVVDERGGNLAAAAKWYRENRQACPHPVIPYLRKTFDLRSIGEAVAAVRLARQGGGDGIATP